QIYLYQFLPISNIYHYLVRLNVMSILLIYYTRTGNTKFIAEKISEKLNCEAEQIIDLKKRSGLIGWLKSGYEASLEKLTNIKEPEKDPGNFDLIIMGTPVWNKRISSAIRTYISEMKEKNKTFNDVALFCTYGGRGADNVLSSLAELLEKEPKAKLDITRKEIKNNAYDQKLNSFIEQVSN
ncbi:MAG: NAD(P)H-dependent oxidoreductase, partial [Candidatus Lokiarchaeota archaeon]